MDDLLSFSLVLTFGVLFVFVATKKGGGKERQVIALAFGFHAVCAIAQVVLTLSVYGGGDIIYYWRNGSDLADIIRSDFARHGTSVAESLLFGDTEKASGLGVGDVSATTNMITLCAFVLLFTQNSIYASGLAVGTFAFAGKLALYHVFREDLDAALRPRMAFAVLAVPSVAYWSSALLKESLAVGGLGFCVWGMGRVLKGKSLLIALLAVSSGAAVVAWTKPYILFPLALSACLWFYWRRAQRAGRTIRVRPFSLVVGAALAAFAIVALGAVFPRYAFDTLAEAAAGHQQAGLSISGGSNYSLVDPNVRSFSGQLAYAPLALATSLFRPLPFEVHNLPSAMNAVECTLAVIAFFLIFRRLGWRGFWRSIGSSPLLVFSVSFVILFGVAVGLATTNLGTLSRYRMPLVPFLWAILVVLLWLSRRRRRSAAVSGSNPQQFAADNEPFRPA